MSGGIWVSAFPLFLFSIRPSSVSVNVPSSRLLSFLRSGQQESSHVMGKGWVGYIKGVMGLMAFFQSGAGVLFLACMKGFLDLRHDGFFNSFYSHQLIV
ncbi:hypothetical protein HDK77DRAFT_171887 [Phyllosticta capitalensis]